MMIDRGENLSDTDYRALAEFRYQIRRFLRFSEQAARAEGLEPTQHQLLLALRGLPEGAQATIGTLAERMQIRHHSAVELVDRLVERGLVERHRFGTDRRSVHLRLTPRGNAVLQRLSSHHRSELLSLSPALVGALDILLHAEEYAEEERRSTQ